MKGKTIFIKGVSNDTALANDQLQQLSLMLSGNGLQNELGFAWNNIMISSDVKAALFKKIGDDGFDQADYHEIGIANSNMIRHVVVAGITTKDMLVDAKMFYDQKIVAAILGYADKSELTFTKLWKLLDQHNQNTPSEAPSGDQGVPSTPTKPGSAGEPAQSPQSSSEAQEMKPYSPTFKILDKVIIK